MVNTTEHNLEIKMYNYRKMLVLALMLSYSSQVGHTAKQLLVAEDQDGKMLLGVLMAILLPT